MRILFLTSTFPRFTGDMQADFVSEQARAWCAARPEDEVIVLAPADAAAPSREMSGPVEIVRFRYFAPARWQALAYPAILPNLKRRPWLAVQLPFFLMAEYRAAKRLLAQRRIDLVYAHWVMPQGLVAWWLHAATATPYVLQNHSSDLAVFARAGRFGRRIASRILSASAAVFCVNGMQRDFALSLPPVRDCASLAAKLKVLPMGVTVSEREGIAPRYDLATIGRLSRKKAIDLLILAAEALALQGVRPSIGIAGDGEDRIELQSLVHKADVAFPGFLTGHAKSGFFAASTGFIFPSVTQGGDVEGMPVAMLEALVLGKPVVASRDTNIKMLPEWDEIADTVEFVDDPRETAALANAMRRLAAMAPTERARRKERLQRAMARYRWDRLIEEYLAFIGERLQSAGRGLRR